MADRDPVRVNEIWQVHPIPDPQGRNPKARPVVVLAASPPQYVCVAVTSVSPPVGEAADFVALPWSADGRARTGLRKECWAFTAWVVELAEAAFQTKRGFCPGDRIIAIHRRIADRLDASNGDDGPADG